MSKKVKFYHVKLVFLFEVCELELECVYGYRGFDCRSNLFYLNDGADIVFHAAGAAVVYNIASGIQCSQIGSFWPVSAGLT